MYNGKRVGGYTRSYKMNAEKLKEWISALPESYKEKIVFIGYSKGLTVAQELLKKDEKLQKRTRAIFSLSGPNRSLLASASSKNLMKITGTSSNEDLYELFVRV